MSRSVRRTPIGGIAGLNRSEKLYKAFENRAARRAYHQEDSQAARLPDVLMLEESDLHLNPKEFGNPWAGPKDGRTFFGTLVCVQRFEVGSKGRLQPKKKAASPQWIAAISK